ncbi:MAG: hypothetical protein HC898_11655 [Phycisphaerales bacterium]|nr:hypothetical protein [Phycisphaerales bacterium]
MSAVDKTKLDGIDGSLYVLKTGSTMTGALSINGVIGNALTIDTTAFTVAGGSGNVSTTGTLTVGGTSTLSALGLGVVHSNASGVLSSSQVIGSDIALNTIADDRLQTISTAGKVANSATTGTSANAAQHSYCVMVPVDLLWALLPSKTKIR